MEIQTLNSLNIRDFLEQDDFTFCRLYQISIKNSLQLNSFRKITNYDFSKWCETHYDWLQCIEWLKLVQVAEGIFDQGHAEEKQPPSCC